MPYAVLFPGQGAAVPGVGERWQHEPAWSVIHEAEDVLDRPLARLLLEADAAELATTRSSQLAVFLTSLVVWEAARPRLTEAPIAFAGHSLGQITALVASGAVGRADGFRLAARRAELSQQSADARPGRMAALLGSEVADAERLCAAVDDLWLANDNAPGQVVVGGTAAAVDRAVEVASELGLRRLKVLGVGHAFHTPLLSDVADGLRPLLEEMTFEVPTAPIMANTDAELHADATGWPGRLCGHLVEPVRWRSCQQGLAAAGADTFVEIGPGKVLAGLAKRTVPAVTVETIAQPDELVRLGAGTGTTFTEVAR